VAINFAGTGQSESVTVIVKEGGNVTLSCNASGIPPSMVSWIKVGGPMRINGNELVFTNINRIEAGEYRCEASNECGNASEMERIVVQYKPENFQFAASEIEVCQDKVITFTCSADGNPAVHTYQLFENDTLVTDGSNSHGMWNRTMSTGGVFTYECVANNTAGTGQSETVAVTVNGKQNKLHVVVTTCSKNRIWLSRVF